MAYITNFEYYTNNGTNPTDANWGSYQYVSLEDIVKNFELMYVGNDKILNYVVRHEIIFHAKRGIQELNYDALRSVRVLELTIEDDLRMVLPPDYVNYVRISLEQDGVLFPMVENKQVNFANSYLQDNDGDIVFDIDGNVVEVPSELDMARLAGDTQKLYVGEGIYSGSYGWCIGEGQDWYFTRRVGGMFGADPELSNTNVTFRIDARSGVINFSSLISGRNVVLEYISDGMENGTEASISINKLAETAIYAYVYYEILRLKPASSVPMYEKDAAKRAKRAAISNAKIRLSNLHPSRLLMVLRGQGKWIK